MGKALLLVAVAALAIVALWNLDGLARALGWTLLAILLLFVVAVLVGMFAIWRLKRKVRRQIRQWGMMFGASAARSARGSQDPRRQRDEPIDVEGRVHQDRP